LIRTRPLPELLNEPVFAGSPQAWDTLQRAGLVVIRVALPEATVVLTGANRDGVDGLLALTPVRDPYGIDSIHSYEPTERTARAAHRQGLDRAALARLPFPMDRRPWAGRAIACERQHAHADHIYLWPALERCVLMRELAALRTGPVLITYPCCWGCSARVANAM
jgi:hypothetical protein